MAYDDAFYYIVLAVGVVIGIGFSLFVWRAGRSAEGRKHEGDGR